MRIYLDMDGTLCDWLTPAMRDMGLAHRQHEITDWEMTAIGGFDYVTKHLKTSFEWWENLEKTPWADRLMERAKLMGDVYFLTSGTWEPHAPTGKWLWIKKNYPGMERGLILCEHKHFLANRESVLFDDRDKYVDMFRDFGGYATLIPAPWNSLRGVLAEELFNESLPL